MYVYAVTQTNNELGKVLSDEDDIEEGWISYFDQLMKVENGRVKWVVETGQEATTLVLGKEKVMTAVTKIEWKVVTYEKNEKRQSSWSLLHHNGSPGRHLDNWGYQCRWIYL